MAIKAENLGQVNLEPSSNHEMDSQVVEGFQAYRDFIDSSCAESPQYQGLAEDEYARVINDPNTRSSYVLDPENTTSFITLPQLVPLAKFDWLNAPYISEKAGEAAGAHSEIMHFTSYQNLEGGPGVETAEGLRDLAAREGMIVVDFPSNDEQYETRVQEALDQSGVEIAEVIELGTQTYYAGEVKLKHGYDPLKPISDFSEAFQQMQEAGLVPSADDKQGAVYQSVIDAEQSDRMYDFYHKAFDEEVDKHPCRQGFLPDEFREMLTEHPEVAKLVYYDEGDATTICLLGNDLDNFSWLDKSYFEGMYPTQTRNGQLLYFPSLATDRERQGDRNAEHIVNLIAQMVEYGNNEIVVAFDCGDRNKGFLDAYLEAMINATPEATISFKEVGSQTYKAYKLKTAA